MIREISFHWIAQSEAVSLGFKNHYRLKNLTVKWVEQSAIQRYAWLNYGWIVSQLNKVHLVGSK